MGGFLELCSQGVFPLYVRKSTFKYKRRSFNNGLPVIQHKLYDLFFENPRNVEDFIADIRSHRITNRTLTQIRDRRLIISFSRLINTHPEVLVYSLIYDKDRVKIRDIVETSGLDREIVLLALERLKERGVVE